MFSDRPNDFQLIFRGSPREHSGVICLELAQWYRRSCHLMEIVDDARPRTLTDPNRSL